MRRIMKGTYVSMFQIKNLRDQNGNQGPINDMILNVCLLELLLQSQHRITE